MEFEQIIVIIKVVNKQEHKEKNCTVSATRLEVQGFERLTDGDNSFVFSSRFEVDAVTARSTNAHGVWFCTVVSGDLKGTQCQWIIFSHHQMILISTTKQRNNLPTLRHSIRSTMFDCAFKILRILSASLIYTDAPYSRASFKKQYACEVWQMSLQFLNSYGTEAHSRRNSYKVTGLALLPGSNQKFIIFSLYLNWFTISL